MGGNAIFSQKLDLISENIVFLLSLDSRRSIKDISRKLGLSRRQIEHRLQKLFDEGYLKYLTIINSKERFRVTILAKLRKLDTDLLEKLRKVPSLIKLKETLGMYDISILANVSSTEELDALVKQVSDLLHGNSLRFDVLTHDWEDTFTYSSFCHKPALFNEHVHVLPKGRQLTKDETRVVSLLKVDTTMSYKEIVKRSNLGYRKIKDILEKLRGEGILRCTIDPDYRKLGLQFHNLLVKVEPGCKDKFEKFLLHHPRVHWVKHSSGRWDYILSIATRDMDEFVEVTREIRTESAEILLDATALISKIRETRKG